MHRDADKAQSECSALHHFTAPYCSRYFKTYKAIGRSRNKNHTTHRMNPTNPYRTKFAPNTIPKRNTVLLTVVGSASPRIEAGARANIRSGRNMKFVRRAGMLPNA